MTPQHAWAITDRKSGKVVWVGLERPEGGENVWYHNGGAGNGGWTDGYLTPKVLTRIRISPVAKPRRASKPVKK